VVKVFGPRRNASIVPSGDRLGSVTASEKFVIWIHSLFCGFDDVRRSPGMPASARVNAANAPDNQCEAGAAPGTAGSWPNLTRATADSETCTPQQPQLAGRCFVPGTNPPTGSGNRCDFSTPNCPTLPTAETCQTGSGSPKYGDYNGNACAAGRFYSIWPSSQPPPPSGPAPIQMFFVLLVAAGAQIQSP